MRDHTEREREARIRVQSGMYALPERDGRLDAYRAAVRSAVLAEVRAKVELVASKPLMPNMAAIRVPESHAAFNGYIMACSQVFAALTALEATDGI